jgi:hypothetical protein
MRHLIAALAATFVSFVAVALFATSVKSEGVNLSWDDCGSHGAQVRTFACNTNAGLHTIVGSFVAPLGLDAMTSNEIFIDLTSEAPTLPPWWQLRSGLCRPTSLSANFDFTSGFSACFDYWQGAAVGGTSMDPPAGNRTRIKVLAALAPGDPHIVPIAEGTEVYSFKVRINNAKTTGLGACSGCDAGACIVLDQIRLNQTTPLPSFIIQPPATRKYVGWQCPAYPVYYDHSLYNCSFAGCLTPATSPTWGQLKQLYR